MGVSLAVHEAQTVQELSEKVAGLVLRKAATESNEVKKLSATNKLKDNILDVLLALLWVGLLALIHFNESDDVWVLKLREGLHFSVDKFLE